MSSLRAIFCSVSRTECHVSLSDMHLMFDRVPIDAIQKYVSWQDGLYSLTVFWVTRDEFLYEQTVFVCLMNIPNTGHRERRQITYPGAYTKSLRPCRSARKWAIVLGGLLLRIVVVG